MALDQRAFPILYVDSDAACAEAFCGALGEQFAVATAAAGEDALRMLESSNVAVLVVEQSLADMAGVDMLERARILRPEAARVLTAETLRSDLAEQAINRGHVGGYLAKPWQPGTLRPWMAETLLGLHRDGLRRRLEMGLWHGGQTAAATTIYEELVHELSNPLGALDINASLVADLLQGLAANDAATREELRASLEMAVEAHADSLAAIEQMKSLVSRMRRGRRAQYGPPGRCDAAHILDATVNLARREVEKVARLEVHVDESRTLAIEGSALGQLLLNLLLNAAQAVTPEHKAHNHVRVLAKPQGERFLISVWDNGPGIPSGFEERVFEPFFTTRENGTGLGLAICRELVNRAHGTITVENRAGGGARFEIAIPIAK